MPIILNYAATRLTAIDYRRVLDMMARLAYIIDRMGNRRSKTTSGIGVQGVIFMRGADFWRCP